MADEMMNPDAKTDTVDDGLGKAVTMDEQTGEAVVSTPPPMENMPEEEQNLVPFFLSQPDGLDKNSILVDLPEQVIADFDDDWESSSEWREKRRKRNKLRYGDLSPKSFPFENCANVHFPVMLERELRLAHRIYSEIFPANDYVFTAIPASSASRDRSDLATLHSNWQIRKEISDFFRQQRRGITEFVGNGDVVFHSSRDIERGVNRHELLSCEEFCFPYVWKTTAVDMSDVPRKTRILRKYKHELIALEDSGKFSQVDKLLEQDKKGNNKRGRIGQEIETAVHDDQDKFHGLERPEDSTLPVYEVLEQHTWFKFPGDERDRPVIAFVEYSTGILLGLCLREQPDPKDENRYEKQTQDIKEFNSLVAQYKATQQKHDQMMAMLPTIPPDEAAIMQGALAQGQLQLPQPAPWMKLDPTTGMATEPSPVKIIPIEQFSHGSAIENIDGSLGFGIGFLLEGFNETADTLASQFIDSATLANTVTGLVHDQLKMDEGDTLVVPGELRRVRGPSIEQFQNAIKLVQFPQANPQMLEMVKLQLENADGVSSAPDVLSGESGKANETYRGIATRVEQATRQLSVLARNYLEVVTQVIKNNCHLNYLFMDDYELKSVIDARSGQSVDVELSRKIYRDDFDIAFSADTRFASRSERVTESDQLLGLASQSMPKEVASMVFTPEFFRQAALKSLKARGMYDMLQYISTKESMDQQIQSRQQSAQQQQMMQVAKAGHLPDVQQAQQQAQQQQMQQQAMQQQQAQEQVPQQHGMVSGQGGQVPRP